MLKLAHFIIEQASRDIQQQRSFGDKLALGYIDGVDGSVMFQVDFCFLVFGNAIKTRGAAIDTAIDQHQCVQDDRNSQVKDIESTHTVG